MAPRKKRASEPPELPPLNRGLRFGRWQMVGLAIMISIPVLAAFEVFGEGSSSAGHSGATLALSAEYPSRVRHGTPEEVTVLVTNRGPSPLDTVTVHFDSSYVARFTDPQFLPSTTDAYEVELAGVGPGETRTVRLGVRANEYGRHRGRIVASHGGDTAYVSIGTIVFP